MATTEVDPFERYIELGALECLLTSSYTLGQFLDEFVSFQLTAGLNIGLVDDPLDLEAAFMAAVPGEDDEPTSVRGLLTHARVEFLVERMLRSIDPERITEAADHFHEIAEEKLARAHGLIRLETERSGGDA